MARIGFRKTIRLGRSGVRLNVSKRGVGVSAGTKGLRIGTGPSGTRARATLPGTGLYMEKRIGKGGKRARSQNISHTSPENNQQVYQGYLDMIEELKNYHIGEVQEIHWNKIIQDPPFEGGVGPREKRKREQLNAYEPSFVVKLLRLEALKRNRLKKAMERAREEDQREYAEWLEKKEIGEGILRNQDTSVTKALERYSTFYHHPDMMRDVTVSLKHEEGKRIANVLLYVRSDDDLPNEDISLTKTGRVSKRKMGKGKFYELQQQHLSSVVIRVIRELFALSPIEEMEMNVYKREVDTAIGKERDLPIIAVRVKKEELTGIQFDSINPFDTLARFEEHRMNFRKTKGFGEIEPF